MGDKPAEALEVLREVWRSHGQTKPDTLDPDEDKQGSHKSCKRMDAAGVGFDDFAAGGEDLRAAWRARLEREGKLNKSGGSVRELVLGPGADSR